MRIISFILILFSINTWALKERALFSINGRIYFTKEANFLFEAYKYSKCSLEESGKSNFLEKLIGDFPNSASIKAETSVPNNEELIKVKKILLLGKLISLEHEFLSKPNFKKCNTPKRYENIVTQIYNANLELNKRYRSYISGKDTKDKSAEGQLTQSSTYRTFILKDIQSRLFL